MIINYAISGSAPAGFSTAVTNAVQYFENALTNNATVSLTFTWAPLAADVVAQSLSGADFETVSYASWRAAILANAQGSAGTADNLVGAESLPATDPFGNGNVLIPYPLATAIGLRIPGVSKDPASTDTAITLNSSLAFAFDPNNRAVSGQYDAIGALEHEISEALGRMAGSDGESNQTGNASPTLGIGTPLNFFRYSSPGQIDLSSDYSGASFSLNGGSSELIQMGESGSDLSDWGSDVPQGDAVGYAAEDQQELFTAVDLQAMSAIGWHVAANTALDLTVDGDTFNATGAAINVRSGAINNVLVGSGNTITAGSVGTLTVNGTGNTVNIQGSQDNITVNGANTTVNATAGDGNLTVIGDFANIVESGSNTNIAVSGSNENVSATGYNDAIMVSGSNVTVADGGGVVQIDADGVSNVQITDPNGQVSLNYSNDSIGISNANVYIGGLNGFLTGNSISGNGNTVTVYASQRFSVAGNNNTVILDGSNETATVTGFNETVNAYETDPYAGASYVPGGPSPYANQIAIIGGNGQYAATPDVVSMYTGAAVTLEDNSNVAVSGSGISVTAGNADSLSVTGSSETVTVTGTGSTVSLGGNGQTTSAIDSVSFAGSGTTTVTDNSRVSVSGTDGTVNVGNSDFVGVIGSSEAVDVSGASSAVWIGENGQFTSAIDNVAFVGNGTANILDYSRVGVSGSGETVNVGNDDFVGVIGASETVNVNGTSSAVWIGENGQFTSAIDNVAFAGSGTANILDYSRVGVSGSDETVNVGNYDSVGAIGSSEIVNVNGTNSAVWIGGNGQTTSAIDSIGFAGSGSANVIDNSRVAVSGNGLTINVGNNDFVGAIGSGETVNVDGANSAVWIGGNGQGASTADAISFEAGGTANVLTSSNVSIAGNGASVNLAMTAAAALLGQSDTVALSGSDTLSFATAFGLSTLAGFDSSDQVTLSKASFGAQINGFDYWAHLLADATVSGGNTTITLDGSDSIVLRNYTLTAANRSQFHFS